ncbi:MAG: efflux RND transporter periplasmic adaptor subunit [Proteobacteria bacterium]|nr:efflux RND transporter periplasmic adaptor subunit [Pseudomonadota bacterium]MBU4469297.1 efflux RND transporter periplasmic adaptor subunit [Pseudomonadota bacterium]MCG2750776.1 efflux RND transporter periplasmic adaptor subunit [Desulfobacteraceae bacterium]
MKNKWAIIGVVILLVFLAIFFLKGGKKKQEAAMERTPGVSIIIGTADARSVEYVLNQVGTLVASQEVTIRTEAQGKVVEILFNEGGAVNKGDLLVRLDDAKIKAEIDNLQAKVEQLQVRLKNKQKSLERNRSLVEQKLVSAEKFDDMITEIDEIKSQIIQTIAGLNRQKENLSDTMIRAPFDGVAGGRSFSPGHYLRVGDPVMSLVDLNPLKIELKVPEKYKKHLVLGQDVNLTVDAYADVRFKGKLSFIDPAVEVGTRSFLIKALVDNNEKKLSPGMFAKAQLITEVRKDAVTVPWESVIQTENETYLYATDGKTAKKHVIELGKVVEDRVEILNPTIAPGDAVILEGKFAVKDGVGVVNLSTDKTNSRPEEEQTLKPMMDPKK